MNPKTRQFMFTKSEIKALRTMSTNRVTVSELHNQLMISQSGASLLVKKLQNKSMVRTKRVGMKKYVQINDVKHAVLVKELLQTYPHIPWEKLLSNSSLLILFEILNKSTYELQDQVSKRTVLRHLSKLAERGIIKESNGRYMITPRYEPLIKFLEEYQSYIIKEIVESIAQGAVTLWQKDLECLIRTSNHAIQRDHLFKTGISRFSDFGIKLITNYEYYFYSDKKNKLRKEDFVLHALLAEKDSVRNVTYCLIFIKKLEEELDKKYLITEAEKFNLQELVQQILGFLIKRKRSPHAMLPSWSEFVEKAKEYDVI
jgi:DNA-binding transcriptional ArsR family regulator